MRKVLVAAVMLVALTGCSTTTSSAIASPKPTDPIYRNDFPAREQIGTSQTIAVGAPSALCAPHVQLTLRTFTDPVTGAAPAPPAGQRYVAADLMMQNLDAKFAASVDIAKEVGLSLGGDAPFVACQAGVTIPGGPPMPTGPTTIAPGQTLEGWVTFLIPAQSRTYWVVYTASLSGWKAGWVVLPPAPN